MSKRLYRSRTNKVVAGVCGGIGEYFNIDPVIVRLLVVVFTLMGGSGFVVYLVAYVIIPLDNVQNNSMEEADKTGGSTILKILFVIGIIIMGMILLAILLGIFRWTLGVLFHGFLF